MDDLSQIAVALEREVLKRQAVLSPEKLQIQLLFHIAQNLERIADSLGKVETGLGGIRKEISLIL
ncbi:hypothetical protein ABO04_00815 [Nitrosomonas sp. HPC101]|uniref:hypothetical protein n=1 Tax=Nitrosomonas sp. HPC101 TaxID=1658667 RepID=UPI00136B8475|nr:hypothetical protein [Nitrosomonas sp. HPC101]MXS84488.1 hypothetical protein [Nitrosomonas sp. HPC101]